MIFFLCMAHYEFNKKNGNYISFKDAILIGLIVLGIGFFISTVYNYINYEFIMKEKMQLYYSNMMSEQYGEYPAGVIDEIKERNEYLNSSRKIILS